MTDHRRLRHTILGVARALTGRQLAEESGVSVGLIETLTGIGVLKPAPDGGYTAGDVIRVEATQSFLEAGMTVELLYQGIHEGLFTFDFLDRFHPEPAAISDWSATLLSEKAGVPLDLLGSIYLEMGLPEPDPDRLLREEEVEILRTFLEAWSIADRDALLRAARLMGESARLVSEGWTRLYVEKVADPLAESGVPMQQRIETIVETTERTARLAPTMLTWLLQRHLRRSVDRANIEGLEAAMAEHGLMMPAPQHLPAIAFVDVSGFTKLTETHGDEIAMQVSEMVRESGQRIVRSRGGSVVKLLGDGLMLHFDTVAEALMATMELVGALGSEHLPAHAGIHAGGLLQHDGDYYGRTVNLASRVAGEAGPGEVLVTRSVVDAVAPGRFTFEPLEEARLKGIVEPVALYRARASDER